MKKYPLLFLLSLSIYLLHFYITKHGIYGDGNGYFSIAHTLFFQGKLDFAPIYGHLSHFQGASYVFSRVFWDIKPTATHILNAPWLIGTSLFWLPSFFIVRLVSLIPGSGINMFHPLYEMGCGITGIILVLGGLMLLERYLSDRFDKRTARITVLAGYAATQLFYYASFEPALSHQAAFFLFCLYLWVSHFHSKSRWFPAVFGLISGMLFITRPGDLVLLIPFAVVAALGWMRNRRMAFAWATAAFLAGSLPQIIFQKALYGTFFSNPYLQGNKGAFAFISASSVFEHLFGLKGGLFVWSPLLMLGIWGLIKGKSYLFLLSILIYTVFIASWERVAPAGFGNRFFVSAIPLMLVGISQMLKEYRKAAPLIIMAGIVWNLLATAGFYYFKL